MSERRVSIPVTPDLSWVVALPQSLCGQARAASPASLHELEVIFAPPGCAACPGCLERAMEALSLALDDLDDGHSGDATD